MLPVIKKQIIDLMQDALNAIAVKRGIADALPVPHLERPKVAEHGDVQPILRCSYQKLGK